MAHKKLSLDNLSEKDIEKGFSKIQKKLHKDAQKIEAQAKRLKSLLLFLLITLVLSLLFLFLSSDFLESSLNILSSRPEIKRDFMLHSCSASGEFSCTFDLYGSNAVFTFMSKEHTLESLSMPACSSINIKYNNTAVLLNCSFSSFSNNIEMQASYLNQNSGLEHKHLVRVIKIFEITKIKRISSLVSQTLNLSISNLIKQNNKTYK